jgi:hypothetical protein
VIEFVGVFDRLNTQKDRAEKHRQQDKNDLHVAVTLLRVINGQCHCQAAYDQHDGIQAAPECIEVVTTCGKGHRELRTEYEINCKQPAKEHDLLH